MSFIVRRGKMVSKSKLGASKLGAIAFIAAIGLASPAFAANPEDYGGQHYAPSQSGGGSGGYNRKLETYRLKHHPASQSNKE
jgi:hypothetical protein